MPYPGTHCDIVEGARPPGEHSFTADIPVCWPWEGRLDDAATGAAEEEACSGASENASVVDAEDCVSAVAVALWLLGRAVDGG